MRAIIPLKTLHAAKSRLAPDLDPSARRALTAWMFGRVLDACRGASSIDRVLVVAGDQEAVALAAAHGAAAILEPRPGLDAALAAADAACAADSATLVVAADLPLARPADLDLVCAAGARSAVVVAPTQDGGTGALLRRPPRVVNTRYGAGSAAAHLALARAAGVPALCLDVPGLALDIDTAGHLREAALLDGGLARWLGGDAEVWPELLLDRAGCGCG